MSKKILASVSLLCLLSLLLCSCSVTLSDQGTFYGGEMLDDERLAEIRQNVLGEGEEDSSKSASEITPTEYPETDKTAESESNASSQKENISREKDSEENASANSGSLLYWTEGGEVWHISKDCRYLKNKEVLSGNQDDALSAGKKRLCSACGNQ